FMPVHGEYRHQFKHVELAVSRGIPERNTAIPNIGEVWGVNHNSLRQHSNITAGNVYVDGEVIEDGNGIVRDRRILAEYGVLVVLVAINTKTRKVSGDIEIIPRGVNITDERYLDIVSAVNRTVAESKDLSLYELTGIVKKSVRKLFYRDRQFPMIIPVLIED
ncbi:MAG: hypothetical protein J6R34_05210, partial [Clostridia bacterium]|nr:hypothetical protein [Clostridia bacterium]